MNRRDLLKLGIGAIALKIPEISIPQNNPARLRLNDIAWVSGGQGKFAIYSEIKLDYKIGQQYHICLELSGYQIPKRSKHYPYEFFNYCIKNLFSKYDMFECVDIGNIHDYDIHGTSVPNTTYIFVGIPT